MVYLEQLIDPFDGHGLNSPRIQMREVGVLVECVRFGLALR